jgi:signal transduction histidine kinase
MGLFGIGERAAALGGEALVDSTPGEGTRVRVTIPLQALEARRG